MSDTPDDEPTGPFSYRFTSAYPALIVGLSYGPDVTVEHEASAASEGGEPLPDGPVDGATVVLYPGDILTVPEPLDITSLEPVDSQSAPSTPDRAEAPESPAEPPESPPAPHDPETPSEPASGEQDNGETDADPETPTTDQTEQ